MHIGLIGGIGPAATEFYYRGIVKSCAAASTVLELTIAHADMSVLLENMISGSTQRQAQLFRKHLDQLKRAGADVAAVTSIAGHFCFPALEQISPLPLISALESIQLEIKRRGFNRVGLLGSKIAVESGLYGSLAGIEIVCPDDDDTLLVSQAYLEMAGQQRANSAQRELFFNVGEKLCSKQGAEVVILAGTDMFLAFAAATPPFDVIDCAEVHIEALAALAQEQAATRRA